MKIQNYAQKMIDKLVKSLGPIFDGPSLIVLMCIIGSIFFLLLIIATL